MATKPPTSLQLDKQMSLEMCKLCSVEYEVEKSDLAPFIAVMNILHQEYGQTKPEMLRLLIAVLHDYNPYLGKEHRQKTIRYIEMLLDKQPVLTDYVTSTLPECMPHQSPNSILHSLPSKMPSMYFTHPARKPPYGDSVNIPIQREPHISCPTPFFQPARVFQPSHQGHWVSSLSQGYKVVAPVYCPPWFTPASSTASTNSYQHQPGLASRPSHRFLPVRFAPSAQVAPISVPSTMAQPDVKNSGQRKVSVPAFNQYEPELDVVSCNSTKHPGTDNSFRNSTCFPYTQQVILPSGRNQNVILQGPGLQALTKTSETSEESHNKETPIGQDDNQAHSGDSLARFVLDGTLNHGLEHQLGSSSLYKIIMESAHSIPIAHGGSMNEMGDEVACKEAVQCQQEGVSQTVPSGQNPGEFTVHGATHFSCHDYGNPVYPRMDGLVKKEHGKSGDGETKSKSPGDTVVMPTEVLEKSGRSVEDDQPGTRRGLQTSKPQQTVNSSSQESTPGKDSLLLRKVITSSKYPKTTWTIKKDKTRRKKKRHL